MGGGGSLQHQQVVDPDRPRFHVHPPQGWMNDPNGPVYYKGRYHMFYQHLPNACEWAFGIVWGHAVSSDLVHWEHLPPALVPTPGTLDADGCFSGSCVLDSDGTPVLLYTGVRLRSNESAGELPPPEHDLGMVWIETQLAAVPEDPDDELLIRWRKVPSPFLHLPPSHLQLTGWRDPFIFVTNTAASPVDDDGGFSANGYSQELRMLIGSGLKGQGGTALVYKSRSLLEGWELEGTLCEAQNTDTGVVWECPLLVALDPVPRHLRAPAKQLPPAWLVAAHQAAAGGGSMHSSAGEAESGGGFGSVNSMSQESTGPAIGNGTAGTAGSGTIAALGSHRKLRLGPAGALAAQASSAAAGGQPSDDPPVGAIPGTGSGTKQSIAAVPAAAPAAAEEAAGPIAAAGEGKQLGAGGGEEGGEDGSDECSAAGGAEGATEAADVPAAFAFAQHQRADSFAFDRDLSLDDLAQAEEAASAVTAWQQQAASAGGSAAASGITSPAAHGLAAQPAADIAPAAATAASAAAAAAGPDLDAPSDAAALPPGRRGRRMLPDAKLLLESAATLEDWSAPTSQAASPVQPLSGTGTPEGKPSPDKPQRAQQAVPPPPRLDLSPPGRRGGQAGAADQAQQAQQAQQAHHEEDRFAAAFSQIRGIRARTRSKERLLPGSGCKGQPAGAAAHEAHADLEPSASGATEADTPVPPERQWHFFTVSPDAPTNPVLYWMGHVQDTEAARFELETAKGPYRLDLGDVLYAPNVCQDDKGRWLLWGWLQERRKMGSYNYAGCLTLPRELHCTEDGRLVQAPIPELVQLRQGAPYQQHGVRVPAEECIALKCAPAAPALDIELTLDRGSAFAAGLLFRSHEAEADGGTALIYDWERNTLEAIFNVPPNWQPQAAAQAVPQSARHSGTGEQEAFDPAILLTPRPGGIVSRTPSMIFSPEGMGMGRGFDSLTASPRTATESLAGEQSSVSGVVLSPQSGISIAGAPQPPPLDLGIPGLVPPPHLAGDLAGSAASGVSDLSAAAAFGRSLPRSLSAIPAGFLTAGGGGGGGGGRALQPGGLPTGGGLRRSVSDVRLGIPRVSSHSSLQGYATSLPRVGGGTTPRLAGGLSPRHSPQAPQPIGEDTDADLDFLLDELAAPMREAPPPVVEPRRVGGPLPLMQANQPIHLRILVDHSCVEVYTGTGEVLSTRIYRGQAPHDCADAGISFIAFGGAALVKSCSTWEMGSAWEHPAAAEPLAAKAAAATAAAKASSPKQAAVAAAAGERSPGGSAAASPAAPAAPAAPAPSGPDGIVDLEAGAGAEAAEQQRAAAAAAAAAADALLDDLVACVSPHCSAPILAGAAFAAS
ncbi:hypothetical protein ABPG75_010131 [Micractinium tetrahymenae]